MVASAKPGAIFFVAAKCFIGYSETPEWRRASGFAGYPTKQITAGAVSYGKALHNKLLTKYSNSVSFMKVSYVKVSHNQVRLNLKITVDFCKVIIYNKYIR